MTIKEVVLAVFDEEMKRIAGESAPWKSSPEDWTVMYDSDPTGQLIRREVLLWGTDEGYGILVVARLELLNQDLKPEVTALAWLGDDDDDFRVCNM